jgi:23S rRNA (uridine2552-2'-O)-methyltransferase
MKRPKSKKNRWSDHYTKQARKDRYPARSVYKLKEIQRRFRVIGKGARVLDLGCAPGSWLLYAAELTGSGGQVVGVDIKPVDIALPAHVSVLKGDILASNTGLDSLAHHPFDVVLSDMAPATTGQKDVDAVRSLNLCEAALEVGLSYLKPGGSFVCKIFHGEDTNAFTGKVKEHFRQLKRFKPQSSRKASREMFIIGVGMR